MKLLQYFELLFFPNLNKTQVQQARVTAGRACRDGNTKRG